MIQETTEQMSAPRPLYQPGLDDPIHVPPVDTALTLARQVLAQYQGADVHDSDAMICAAVALEVELRRLVSALDAESTPCRPDRVAAWRRAVAS